MSTKAHQYSALLKTRELAERDLLSEKLKIEKVLVQRQLKLDGCEQKLDKVKVRLEQLRAKDRLSFVQASDFAALANAENLEKKLVRLTTTLEIECEDARREVSLAQERLQGIDGEWQEARVEKKRIEKMIERHKETHIRKQAAQEAMQQDERQNKKFWNK